MSRKTTIKAKAQEQSSTGLGAAGLSFSLASGASAAPAANIPTRSVDLSHEFILAEEEVSDVSLATFYVFDMAAAQAEDGSHLLAHIRNSLFESVAR
jgi:hypothetical protein